MAIAPTQPRYSREEFRRRGDEIYEREIQRNLKSEDDGKFIAIDIETGDYEVASKELDASDRLFARHPNAQIWFRRVGSPHLYRFGFWR